MEGDQLHAEPELYVLGPLKSSIPPTPIMPLSPTLVSLRVVQKVVEAHRGKIDPHFFRSEDHKDKVNKLLGKYIEQYNKK